MGSCTSSDTASHKKRTERKISSGKAPRTSCLGGTASQKQRAEREIFQDAHGAGITFWKDYAGILRFYSSSPLVDTGDFGIRMHMTAFSVNHGDGNSTPGEVTLTLRGSTLHGETASKQGSKHANFAGVTGSVSGVVNVDGEMACRVIHSNNTSEVKLGTFTHELHDVSGGYVWEGYGKGREYPRVTGAWQWDRTGPAELIGSDLSHSEVVLCVFQPELLHAELLATKIARGRDSVEHYTDEWLWVLVLSCLSISSVFCVAQASRELRLASDTHGCILPLLHLVQSAPWLFGRLNVE